MAGAGEFELDELDVVGYEYEAAAEACRRQGIRPVLVVTGERREESVLRVVRQQRKDGRLVLTCSYEAWT